MNDYEGSRMAGCLPDFGGPMVFAGCHADFYKTERVLCYLLGDLKAEIGCLSGEGLFSAPFRSLS
jgi:hypothetical protein